MDGQQLQVMGAVRVSEQRPPEVQVAVIVIVSLQTHDVFRVMVQAPATTETLPVTVFVPQVTVTSTTLHPLPPVLVAVPFTIISVVVLLVATCEKLIIEIVHIGVSV
jgi:hypothetical protein